MASVSETSVGALSGSTIITPPQKPVSSPSSSTPGEAVESKTVARPEFDWMVKPCFIYKEEYKDCKSFKARFHQYFVDGKSSECFQWKEDYDNCLLWEEKKNMDALKKVVDSEKMRVRKRLLDHYSNNVWEHRSSPPSDWNKQLPDHIKKSYEDSFLRKRADDLRNGTERLGDFRDTGAEGGLYRPAEEVSETSSCSIM